MYKNNDDIYDAALALEQLSGLSVTVETQRKEYDAIININGYQFAVEAKNEVRKENKGILISQITKITNLPFLVVTNYITSDAVEDFKEKEINYLDSAGNCFIKNGLLFISVSGQKVHRNKQKTNQAKAFQEAGIKLLFRLLSNPENLQLSYRELAELAGVSIGSVSNIMSELENQHYILKTKKRRILKNKPELLERWTIAYHDVLRPRLFKKQMRFVKQLSLDELLTLEDTVLWGGEPGAAILTNYLFPEKFALYTTERWQDLGPRIGLVPDNNGSVEVLQQFWEKKDDKKTVPPLLIYADLMGSGYSRNIETAKIILENELQHLK
ncbi:hypothetical protein Barb6XT_03109 [Bacteroidales bacterium Barb6XT]|nr:hypothetical protein Barb6XT_03109 [Bacteroidales bacterium Barb6XT]